MKDNQVNIVGGFLSKGLLTYKEGSFKAVIFRPEQNKIVTISFSEHCIDQIRFTEYSKGGVFEKSAYFSIILTDGRELKVKSNDQTYRKIYEKNLSSRRLPTVIFESPFDFLQAINAKWVVIVVLTLGGIAFCSADPTPEPNHSMPIATNSVSTTQNTVAKSVVSTGEACRFKNFDITSWKDSSGDGTYTCSSNHFDVSPDQMDGSLPNYLMYAAQGSQNYVAQVKIKLYVNNASFRTGSTNKFIEACNSLSSKVTGKKLPNSLINKVKNRKNGSDTINGFSITVNTDTWASGNGYEQNCIISVAKSSTPRPIQPVVYSPQKLCKAAISVEFFHPVNIIKVTKTGSINELHYIRPADGSKWQYACKVEGNRIVWASIDPDRIGSSTRGRWRDNYAAGDNKLTYSVNSNTKQLVVTQSLTGTTQTFELSKFGR